MCACALVCVHTWNSRLVYCPAWACNSVPSRALVLNTRPRYQGVEMVTSFFRSHHRALLPRNRWGCVITEVEGERQTVKKQSSNITNCLRTDSYTDNNLIFIPQECSVTWFPLRIDNLCLHSRHVSKTGLQKVHICVGSLYRSNNPQEIKQYIQHVTITSHAQITISLNVLCCSFQ